MEVVSFSADNFPKVHLIINPAVCMFFIYSSSYASFCFLQMFSLGESQPLVPAEALLLTVKGEPREQKSGIDRYPRGPLCVLFFLLFPQRISAALWGSKLLWHLNPHNAASHGTLQLLGARLLLVSRRAKAFCTGINPSLQYRATQGSCKLT